ncbi:hypothetical protein N7462_001334 [Penicillium macrosclerotiorum]|uniref:uncharacterized protein n=1 Tax=Penicillium macrosclerotiorum TaxID=303699 RepID=UPI00254802E5|nr:uncharacterized protein N7462_001334 [Penicillium macrosclerotiorum]KAJ5691911.1 hypothetical protein N7462_001334 [Penicillium macrosclerotiorum]
MSRYSSFRLNGSESCDARPRVVLVADVVGLYCFTCTPDAARVVIRSAVTDQKPLSLSVLPRTLAELSIGQQVDRNALQAAIAITLPPSQDPAAIATTPRKHGWVVGGNAMPNQASPGDPISRYRPADFYPPTITTALSCVVAKGMISDELSGVSGVFLNADAGSHVVLRPLNSMASPSLKPHPGLELLAEVYNDHRSGNERSHLASPGSTPRFTWIE